MLMKRIMRSPEEGGGGEAVETLEEKKEPVILKSAVEGIVKDRLERDRKVRSSEEAEKLQALGVESWEELGERLKGAGGGGEAKDEGELAQAEARWSEKLKGISKKHGDELEAARTREREALELAGRVGVKAAIRTVAKDAGAHDVEDIVRLVGARARLNPKTEAVEVLDESGENLDFDEHGKALTLEGLVAGIRSRSPHLFSAATKNGSDTTSGDGTTGTRTIRRADFEKKTPAEQMTLAREGKVQIVD